MHGDIMYTMSDLGGRIRNFVIGLQALIDGPPGFSAVLGAERTRRGDGDEDSLWITRVQEDRMQAHSACTWLPEVSFYFAQPGQFPPRLAAVRGTEQSSVLHSSIYRIAIGQGRFESPHPFEFPGMLRAVVQQVCAWGAIVGKLVSHGLPQIGRASCRERV